MSTDYLDQQIDRQLNPFINIYGVVYIPGIHYPMRFEEFGPESQSPDQLQALVKYCQDRGWDKTCIRNGYLQVEGTGASLRYYPAVLAWLREQRAYTPGMANVPSEQRQMRGA